MPKKDKKKTKRKISKKKIIIFVIIACIIIFLIKIFNTNITNIYISGNSYLTDQEIIDMCKLTNYPKTIKNLSFTIEKRLEKNKYIAIANVKKNIFLNKVYIEIEENYPLFYNSTTNKTVLYNGEETDDNSASLIITNSIPNKIYDDFLNKLKQIDIDILNRISELEYSPNEKYKERFFLLMNDGNYVYITLDKFLTLNKYLDIIKNFSTDEKGIIRLDSGGYFDKFND